MLDMILMTFQITFITFCYYYLMEYYCINQLYVICSVSLLLNHLLIAYYLYPNCFDNLIIEVSYNCIYYYSKLQMEYTKIKSYINFVKTKLYIPHDIEFIRNGEVVYKTYKTSIDSIKEIPQFDFIIYSDNKLYNDIPVNKVVYKSIPTDFTYAKTNFKFIIVNFIQNNNVVQLNLSNNNYNYYIVNNEINYNFLLYFLNNIEKCKIQGTGIDYKLQIMDHNINEIDVLPRECLIFNNDDYVKK